MNSRRIKVFIHEAVFIFKIVFISLFPKRTRLKDRSKITYTVKKNPDDFPAVTGLPRYFQINLDWFPVDDLPEIFGCSSIARNAIRKYPFVLPHIIVFSSTVLISKVAGNLLIVGKLSLFSKGMHLQYGG